jgi:hypothetical protein
MRHSCFVASLLAIDVRDVPGILLKADDSNPKLSVNLKRKKCMFSKEYLFKVAGIT